MTPKMMRFYAGCFLLLFIESAIENNWRSYGTPSWAWSSALYSLKDSAFIGFLVVFLAFIGVFYFADDASSKLERIPGRRYLYYVYGAAYPLVMAGTAHVVDYIITFLPFSIIFAVSAFLIFVVGLVVIPALFVHLMLSRGKKHLSDEFEMADC